MRPNSLANNSAQFTVYSFVGSQWAGVVHLTLAEKGFADYNVKEVDLGACASDFLASLLQN